MSKNIIVITGGAGFVGSNLILHFLKNTKYKSLRKERYASFDEGNGAAFEKGNLSLEELSSIGKELKTIQQKSGKQELFEQIIANSF